MTDDERQADREAVRSAWRKLDPAMKEAGGDPDKLQKVRDTPLTEREAAVMETYLGELDWIIASLRDE